MMSALRDLSRIKDAVESASSEVVTLKDIGVSPRSARHLESKGWIRVFDGRFGLEASMLPAGYEAVYDFEENLYESAGKYRAQQTDVGVKYLRKLVKEELAATAGFGPSNHLNEEEEQIVTRGNYRGHTHEEAAVLRQLREISEEAWKLNKALKIPLHQRKNSDEQVQRSKYAVEQLANIDSSVLTQYAQTINAARKAVRMATDEYYSYLP
jgi:hypothetical protein